MRLNELARGVKLKELDVLTFWVRRARKGDLDADDGGEGVEGGAKAGEVGGSGEGESNGERKEVAAVGAPARDGSVVGEGRRVGDLRSELDPARERLLSTGDRREGEKGRSAHFSRLVDQRARPLERRKDLRRRRPPPFLSEVDRLLVRLAKRLSTRRAGRR